MTQICCICGREFESQDQKNDSGSVASSAYICSVCCDRKKSLDGSDETSLRFKDAWNYFERFLGDEIGPDGDLMNYLNAVFSEPSVVKVTPKADVHEVKPARSETGIRRLLMSTGYDFQGYRITDYLGIISGEIVLGTGFLSEFKSGFSDFFGVESNAFAEKLETAKAAALEKLQRKARKLKANALIGLDFDYITFGGNMIGISANATAVKIEKIPDDKVSQTEDSKCAVPIGENDKL